MRRSIIIDSKEKAKELFEIMVQTGKSLSEIPRVCTQGEIGALLYLTSEKDGITASELSEVLKVSMPRITALLNSLEEKKLIAKIIDSNDKRRTIINITEKGKILMQEKKDVAINNMAKILQKLDYEDIERYIEISGKIQKIIMDIQE